MNFLIGPYMKIDVVHSVSSALTVASLRNQAIASNIAHRDVQNYQRLKVSFQDAMGAADDKSSAFLTDLSTSRPRLVADESGSTPSLEEDMVALSSNALNYQTLARALSRYFSIAEVIASGGKN